MSLTNAEDSVSDDNNDTTKENKGFFKRLVAGLSKTRNSIVNSIDSVFSAFSSIDEDLYEELEEILITSDIGVKTTMEILDNLRDEVKEKHIKEPSELRELLIQNLTNAMNIGENEYDFENKKSIILVIGVNGVGKTTTIGKLAGQYKSQGKKVVLAAADTFRAAASEQLVTWANRAGVDIVASNEGADPGSVIFDAIASGKSKDADLIICDTAGRLHNKKNLMEELKKLDRIISKEYGDAHRENFIVLDATTGQNALEQAKQFKEVAEITGVILTKMDGTAKGGIAIAIQSELGIPVKFIGVGESIEDLQKFDSEKFIQALFTKDE
ncbi:signal recognition particle-docking protein FtsY [Eubacterium uniforme]|uniref:signal recognition particle-docking protein FtsY n=1 Tax=uncultured Eubacterium sp. TaxID=165185 RepID=UPI001FA8C789|nr:signal recognition particle-docking protein FtsY [Eubacterium uniforme]